MKPVSFSAATFVALCLGNAASAASMHTMVFTGSGTFAIPATAAASTEFEFTVVGGGGGGGGCSSTNDIAPGGGSGGAGLASFSGFTAGQAVAITVGAGGTAGASSGTAGGSGGGSRVKAAGVNIVTTTGGKGSPAGSAITGNLTGGAAGTFAATAGTSGLTLASSLDYAAEEGLSYRLFLGPPTFFYPVAGGGNPIGHAGTFTDYDGALGGGALGCQNVVQPGGTGGGGVVIVRWAL